jgi:hypothetical protein
MSGANNWSGTGWTVGSGVYTHVAGANSATLAGYAAVIGKTYQIVMTVVTTTSGTFTINYGGASAAIIGRMAGTLTAYTVLITAASTAGLSVTPDATWAGNIDNVSVMILTPSTPTLAMRNSSDLLSVEGRPVDALSFGLGVNSLRSSQAASFNTAYGANSLKDATSGGVNTAIGANTLSANTTGTDNVALGYAALSTNTVGIMNTALGRNALRHSTVANYNTAVGMSSMLNNTEGSHNTSVGTGTLGNNTNGGSNTAMGYGALASNGGGSTNTSVGVNSLQSNVTGSNNVSLGYYAGGYNTASNKLYIDNQNRANTSGDDAGAIITGTMDATPANQMLRFNAQTWVGGLYASNYGGQLTVKNVGTQQNYLVGSTSDFSPASAGTQVSFGLGATTGNTYGTISVLSTGGTVYNNLALVPSGGKVGIGTNAPSVALDVVGTIQASTSVKTDSVVEKTSTKGVKIQAATDNVALTDASYDGKVGELLTVDTSAVTATWSGGAAGVSMASFVVPTGNWLIIGNAVGYNDVRGPAGSMSLIGCDILNATDVVQLISNPFIGGWSGTAATGDVNHVGLNCMVVATIPSAKTVQFRVRIDAGAGTPTGATAVTRSGGKFMAIRLP